MKQIKNERGFTLIELLAVIVVLAIVLLMGAMAVIPRMNDARKQVFALEANTAIQGASTFLMNNALKGSGAKVFPTSPDKPECVSIQELITDGIVDFDSSYKGYIIVQKKASNSNVYLYRITMTNGSIVVFEKGVDSGENVDITSDMVVDLTTQTVPDACPSPVPSITG